MTARWTACIVAGAVLVGCQGQNGPNLVAQAKADIRRVCGSTASGIPRGVHIEIAPARPLTESLLRLTARSPIPSWSVPIGTTFRVAAKDSGGGTRPVIACNSRVLDAMSYDRQSAGPITTFTADHPGISRVTAEVDLPNIGSSIGSSSNIPAYNMVIVVRPDS